MSMMMSVNNLRNSIYSYENQVDQNVSVVEHIISRVSMDASPILTLVSDNKSYHLTLDSGATCNCIRHEKALQLNAKIRPTRQRVKMADGETDLNVVGETDVVLYRNNKPFYLNAVVCDPIDSDILAGMDFMKKNDVGIRPAMNEIMLNGNEFIKYDPRRKHLGQARSLTGYTIRSNSCRTVFPGECTEFQVSSELKDSCVIEPRLDARCNKGSSSLWPIPQVVPIEKGVVKLFNSGQDPIIIKKSDHLGQVLPEIHHPTDSEITHQSPSDY